MRLSEVSDGVGELRLPRGAFSGEDMSALRAHRCTRRRRAIHHGTYLSCPSCLLDHLRPARVRFGELIRDGRAGCDLLGLDVTEPRTLISFASADEKEKKWRP